MVRSFRQRLALAFGIQRSCGQNLLFFQNPRNLLRAFAVNAKVEDELDDLGRFFIQNPVFLVLRAAAVSVGRFAHVLAAGSSLPQTDTNLLAGITGIPLVEHTSFGKVKRKQQKSSIRAGLRRDGSRSDSSLSDGQRPELTIA